LSYKPALQTLTAKPQPKNETAGITQARKHIVSIDHAGTYHSLIRHCHWVKQLKYKFFVWLKVRKTY